MVYTLPVLVSTLVLPRNLALCSPAGYHRKNSTQAFKPMTLRLLKNSAWVVCEVCKTGDEFCADEIVILFAQLCLF